MVVPQSTAKVYEDNEHGLFTVTLFNKVVDEFKHHAREHKFYVKDFVYNEDSIQQEKGALTKLNQVRQRRRFGHSW
jgi:V-type H+-transporting ATPase subunit C